MHAGPCLCRYRIDVFKMILWEYQGVAWLHGLYVKKCECLGILINLVSRDVSGNDSAKYAIRDRVV